MRARAVLPVPTRSSFVLLTALSLLAGTFGLAWGASPLFAPPMQFAVGDSPYSVTATDSADFNGDGYVDLVTSNRLASPEFPDDNGITVFLGNGDGTFRLKSQIDSQILQGVRVVVADMDEDGIQDLVAANVLAEQPLSVYLGAGDGTFPTRLDAPPHRAYAYPEVADVNGDGHLDVVTPWNDYIPDVTHSPTGHADIWLGDGQGHLAVGPTVDLDAPYPIRAADLNRDGHMDLVSGNFYASYEAYRYGVPGAVSVLLADGSGGFHPYVNYPVVDSPYELDIADVDDDGDLDIAVANFTSHVFPDGKVSILMGRGDGTFENAAVYPLPRDAYAVKIVDINGDGAKDALLAVQSGMNPGGVCVLFGAGGGQFAPGFHLFATPEDPYSLAIQDFNGDDRMDVAVQLFNSHRIGVLVNTGCDPRNPDISGVLPNRGGDAGDITVSIIGCAIQPGASARLEGFGQTILGVTQDGSGDGVVRATFGLAGRPLGYYDILVTNPDATVLSRSTGFLVETNVPSYIVVDVTGKVINRCGLLAESSFDGWVSGNNDTNDWQFVCIQNNSCVNNEWLRYLYRGNEVDVEVPPQFLFRAYTLPWSLPKNTAIEKIYQLGGHANQVSDCCNPGCLPEDSDLQVIVHRVTGNKGPGAAIVQTLLPAYWGLMGKTPPTPPSPEPPANLEELLTAKLKAKVNEFVTTPSPSLALEGNIILQSIKEVVVGIPGTDAADYLAELNLIDPANFSDHLCALAAMLDKKPVIPTSSDRICACSCDPNSKVGPSGAGEDARIGEDHLLDYTVFFENRPDATAPAAEVLVSDRIDVSAVDLTTFSMGDVTIGDRSFTPPPGGTSFQGEIPLPDQNLIVRVIGQLDSTTGLLTWRFQTIDAATGLPLDLVENPLGGFLPANANPPEGEGSVSYSVMPRSNLTADMPLGALATIVFDTNDPLETNTWSNVIDVTKPMSQVNTLVQLPGASGRVVATWSGGDGAGSAVSGYTIYVSDDGGPVTLWTETAAEQDTFPGVAGHTYGFYSVARDLVGNEEDPPAGADLSITVTSGSVAMGFDLTPGTFNLRALGRWVTAYLEPAAPYTPGDVNVSTVRINESAEVDPEAPVVFGDYDADGVPDLALKFPRRAVDETLEPGESVVVTVSGTMAGQPFSGTDHVRVLRSVVSAPAADAALVPGVNALVAWSTPQGVNASSAALLLSVDDGSSWELLSSGLPNTGSHTWAVSDVTTSRARIAVVLVEEADETGYEVEGVLGTSGTFSIGNVTGVEEGGAPSFALGKVPNPMRRELRVTFSLPDARSARLEVFDVAGRKVAARAVGSMGAGWHTVVMEEGPSLASGVYLVRLIQGGKSLTARAILIR